MNVVTLRSSKDSALFVLTSAGTNTTKEIKEMLLYEELARARIRDLREAGRDQRQRRIARLARRVARARERLREAESRLSGA